tara:strand:+ start:66 stop:245 length:180 start_codon:yes stop_codon:yes gene_type:complete
MKKYKKTPSRTSPIGDSRPCLCPDGTYATKCCDGSLEAQGIGALTGGSVATINGVSRTG